MERKRYLTALTILTAVIAAATAQGPGNIPAPAGTPDPDLNEYYRFPLSLGVEYQNLTPFGGARTDYNAVDLALNLRFPIPSKPSFQPFLQGGIITVDSTDSAEPSKWDHSHWYGAGGLAYVHRFARTFELGLQAHAGLSQSVFPNLVSSGDVGALNLMAGAGGKIALAPSYNLAIEIQPGFRYMRSFSGLRDFDGFLFGLGFSASYRFGEDPDSARNLIRSIRVEETQLPPLFSAMQSYYAAGPAVRVSVYNTDRSPLTDMEVSFYQAGYMDGPSPAVKIPRLDPGETRQVGLKVSFNQEVFRTEGVTPLIGEIVTTYKSRGRGVEQRHSVSYDLHDKTAITWDDDRKVGAFITPSDSALRNYASFIRQSVKNEVLEEYSEALQIAMQVYGALTELGLLYQADPSLPYTKVRENRDVVDSISLPRDTLRRITGDCDDLTVLFASILESVGVETGFITVPGHIYVAFNTKIESRSYRDLHPDRWMSIPVDGSLWVPVEVTLLGRQGFLEAWRRGAELWRLYDGETENRAFYQTAAVQQVFRPIGLRETDLGLQYGSGQNIAASFRKEMSRLSDLVLADYLAESRSGGKADLNRLGVAYSRFSRYREAEQTFKQAANLDPDYPAPRINLGNLAYLRQNYPGAIKSYEEANRILARQGRTGSGAAQKLLLNISSAYHAMNKREEAQNYYAQAAAIDAEKARGYAYLGRASEPAAGRAAAQRSGILFATDEE